MNGRPHLEFFTFPRVRAQPAPVWLRMCAALSVSFLLHVAIVFLPDPGARSPGTGMEAGLEVRLLPPEAGAPPEPQSAREASRPQAPPAVVARVPGRGVLPVPAHHFHTADQLTSRARPMNRPRLEVPEGAPAFASGTVILRVWIDALGNLVAVEIEKSDVPPAIAAGAAAAFRALRYIPGEIRGRRVASLMRIEVSYLDGKGTVSVIDAPR
jgi:hypothetical protein